LVHKIIFQTIGNPFLKKSKSPILKHIINNRSYIPDKPQQIINSKKINLQLALINQNENNNDL